MIDKILKSQKAQSLLEIIIALALFVLIIAGTSSLLLGGLDFNMQSLDFIKARFLAQEAVEAVKSIRDRDWGELQYNKSAIASTSGKWVLAGEGTSEQIDKFKREIFFEDVYRDAGDNIVSATTTGANLDASSTLLRVLISWNSITNNAQELKYETYLCAWR